MKPEKEKIIRAYKKAVFMFKDNPQIQRWILERIRILTSEMEDNSCTQ